MSLKAVGAAAALLALAGPLAAQEGGSPSRGLAYARTHCGECHGVGTGNRSPRADATPFKTIAETRGMTAAALAVFLRTPHRAMPDLVVTGQNLDDVIAYILSLREPKEQK